MRRLRRAYAFWREMGRGRSSYPIYRQEIQFWDRRMGGRWRADEVFALLTLANVTLLPAALMIYPEMLLAFGLLDEMIGLFFAAAGAGLVVREREAGTWSLLRATALTSAEIAASKLAGLFYMAWDGARYLALSRWLGTLLALPLLALMLSAPEPSPWAAGAVFVWPAAATIAVYAAFVLGPLVNMLYGGCLGLAVSARAASTGRAVALSLAGAGLTFAAAAGLVMWFARQADLSLWFSGSVLGRHLQRLLIWLIPLGAAALGRLLLIPLSFAAAVRAIEH